MARRPEVKEKTDILSPDGLATFKRKLAVMDERQLRIYYRAVLSECRLETENDMPKPSSIQELVQVWKQLRKAMRKP